MDALQPGQRYRCKQCGNLTRFDVTELLQTTSFFHYTVGGELIETLEVRTHEHTIQEVKCRWCESGKNVEVIEGLST